MRHALTLVAALLLAACYKTEYSRELREPGRVEQVMFIPGGTASGMGYDMTGKGGVSITSTDIPDRYAIVLSCPHGKFSLKPEGATAQRIFNRLKQGDSITISYREEYRVTEEDGHRVTTLERLDFLDAWPRKVEQ